MPAYSPERFKQDTMRVRCLQGDITHADCDVVVNAAKPSLLGGGGVDGAIHRAAGPGLLEACKRIEAVDGVRCPTGDARITPAFQMPCKAIIHTVGPIYSEHSPEEAEALLRSAYESSCRLAAESGYRTIAFPGLIT